MIVTIFNWAPLWQRRRVQRTIGARVASPAMTTIITSTGHHYSILPTREIEYDTHPWVRTAFLRVNWARSSVGEPTINCAILPLNRQYREPKAKSKDELRVNWARSSVEEPTMDGATLPLNAANSRTKGEVKRRITSQHSYDFMPSNWEVHQLQLACRRTALATSKKSTCAGIWQPLTPTDVCTSDVHLQRFTPWRKYLLAWNEITAENCCTADVHVRLRPTISMLFDCNHSNGNGYTKAMTAIESATPTKIAFIYCRRLDVKSWVLNWS